MGTSTDGLLWWGLCSNEEGLPEGVGAVLGLEPDHEDFYDQLNELEEEDLDPLGVSLVRHCSDGWQMYGLALKSTEMTAWRGDPKNVESLAVPPDAEERLRKAAEAIGWPWSEPKWWLASWWG